MGREDGIWAGVGVGWDVEQCEESRKKRVGGNRANRKHEIE